MIARNAPIPASLLTPEQVAIVRAHGRGIRNAGFLFCLIGVLTMIAGRYLAAAPVWLVSIGLGTLVFGWGLFGYGLVRRMTLARSLSFHADD